MGSFTIPTNPNWGSFYTQNHGYQDTNNNQDQMNLQHQNMICKYPSLQKDTCLSSLCCEICKLFPNQNGIENQKHDCLLNSSQEPKYLSYLENNPGSNINEFGYPIGAATNHSELRMNIKHSLENPIFHHKD